ncbi:dethiobiotin synthase [Tindallia magadiensis]|uniref:ATP-dependent dethiobiotin synthetase BioD n=1 Tax=Tindallia magadiensis TaxID=69895 RepID=A0A1I3B307_9FIRM|nr:dethiobiotin synthase [Tindallia magadiensis]SFH56592.1 dethiobiotin synthase [Tindallia magadiensis]
MGKGIFVLGTDTEVGKTFVSAGATYMLNKDGHRVCFFKPVQSGGIYENGALGSGDVQFVRKVAQIEESYERMNTYCFEASVSPHLASEIEKKEIETEKLIHHYQNLVEKYDYVVVEGAGGVVVPIKRNEYYIHHLIKDLRIPVLLVTRANVGTINHTMLTLEFLKSKGIEIKGIVVNAYQGTFYEEDNVKVISAMSGIEKIFTLGKVEQGEGFIERIKAEYRNKLDAEDILAMMR